MVPKIRGKNPVRFAEGLRDGRPVAAHAEQAVQDHRTQWPGTRFFEMELNRAQLADETWVARPLAKDVYRISSAFWSAW